MEHWIVVIYAALVGAAMGSFLNVCIYRLPERESVVRPRSRCPECGAAIRWHDNVPVLSWVLLRGRCRGCGARISVQYPLVELTTLLIWLGAALRYGASWGALSIAVLFTLLLGIAMTDFRTYIIPDEFTLGGLAMGLALAFAPGGVTVLQSVAGAAIGFAFLYGAGALGEWWLKKEAMGGGDIKMMAMVGAFLGPLGALLTIFLGAVIGTIVFLPISMKTRKEVPFGIFLALGAVATAMWGDALVGWYRESYLGL